MQHGSVTVGQDTGVHGPEQGIGQILVGSGAVSHGAEHEFRVLIGVDSPSRLEGRGCVAIRIALFIGVAHIMLRLRTFLDVLERRSSRPGQRLLLLAQDPDEHDEGLKAGGGSLQIKALAVAGESALEQMQGLQGGGHGVVVRPVGIGEGVLPLIVHHRGFGGDGIGGGGVLGGQIAVVGGEIRTAGNHSSGGNIHHSAGFIGHAPAAGQQQNAGACDAVKCVTFFEAGLLPGGSCLAYLTVFQTFSQIFVRLLQCLIDFFLCALRKFAVQVRKGCQRISRVPGGTDPDGRGQKCAYG